MKLKMWGFVFLALALACAGVTESRGETRYVCDPGCMIGGGGGEGGVPTPLTQNQKVELADGEEYLLVGWIRIEREPVTGEQNYKLQVDFETLPWLASIRRKEDPYYLIQQDGSDLSRWANSRVKLRALAQGVVVGDKSVKRRPSPAQAPKIDGTDAGLHYEIRLVPLDKPELLERHRRQ